MGLLVDKFSKRVNNTDQNIKMIMNRFTSEYQPREENLSGQIGESAVKIEATANLKEIDEVTEHTESDEIAEEEPPPEESEDQTFSRSNRSPSNTKLEEAKSDKVPPPKVNIINSQTDLLSASFNDKSSMPATSPDLHPANIKMGKKASFHGSFTEKQEMMRETQGFGGFFPQLNRATTPMSHS